MTPNEYQVLAGRTINNDLSDFEKVNHAVFGMNSEAGEVAGIFQKELQGHPIEKEHLKKEVGDLLWFIAELCTILGWDMEDIMKMNIEKLKKRFPYGFEVDRSLNRKVGDI